MIVEIWGSSRRRGAVCTQADPLHGICSIARAKSVSEAMAMVCFEDLGQVVGCGVTGERERPGWRTSALMSCELPTSPSFYANCSTPLHPSHIHTLLSPHREECQRMFSLVTTALDYAADRSSSSPRSRIKSARERVCQTCLMTWIPPASTRIIRVTNLEETHVDAQIWLGGDLTINNAFTRFSCIRSSRHPEPI